ncbi:MAG: metal ABC transporter solute-binding protein, Zn/Mn family [Candidatus Nanoarchaeia archaeon]
MRGIIILLIVLLIAAGCQSSEDSDKLQVIVSTSPYDTFAESVGEDRINVYVMVPEGANPHSYEPSPKDIAQVSNADAYIKVGSGIDFEENWIDKLKSVNNNMTIIDSSEGINYVEPHLWTSPKNAKKVVSNIYRGFVNLEPEYEKFYKNNTEKYIADLEELDKEITQKLKEDNPSYFLVYHGAWENFAEHYNLTQIAVEKEGKEPSARDLQDTIDLAKKYNISVVFSSPQFSKKKPQVIANEINGEIVLISPLEKDYINNTLNFANALS